MFSAAWVLFVLPFIVPAWDAYIYCVLGIEKGKEGGTLFGQANKYFAGAFALGVVITGILALQTQGCDEVTWIYWASFGVNVAAAVGSWAMYNVDEGEDALEFCDNACKVCTGAV